MLLGRRTAAAIAALGAVVSGVVALPSPSGAATASVRYVALGDSYSAASGTLPLDPGAPLECLRSTVNYPHVIAAKLGAQFKDVTCGAADTTHFFTGQYAGVAPQLDALSKDTQLVTMTIGGNDSNVFIDTIVDCTVAGLSTLGQGSPCKNQYGSSFADTVRNSTYPSLVKALQAVRARSPKAKIGILGYPQIMPATVGCFPQMPIATGDVPYVYELQATLNDAIRRAAAATGTTYVNLSAISTGHDACRPIGVRWVEPVLLGTNPVIVHPNALGESEMAAQAMTVLRLG